MLNTPVNAEAMPYVVMTQLQLYYVGVMESFCKCGSEAEGFVTSDCSKSLYYCPTVIQK